MFYFTPFECQRLSNSRRDLRRHIRPRNITLLHTTNLISGFLKRQTAVASLLARPRRITRYKRETHSDTHVQDTQHVDNTCLCVPRCVFRGSFSAKHVQHLVLLRARCIAVAYLQQSAGTRQRQQRVWQRAMGSRFARSTRARNGRGVPIAESTKLHTPRNPRSRGARSQRRRISLAREASLFCVCEVV